MAKSRLMVISACVRYLEEVGNDDLDSLVRAARERVQEGPGRVLTHLPEAVLSQILERGSVEKVRHSERERERGDSCVLENLAFEGVHLVPSVFPSPSISTDCGLLAPGCSLRAPPR